MSHLVIEQRRGERTEAIHPVAAVLFGGGRIVEKIGSDVETTWRSAAKPFQLETSLSFLAADLRAALAPEDLAIGSASHSGEPGHVARVEGLLGRFGLGVEHLFCGAHAPGYEPAADELVRQGLKPTVLHNNCSGKHAFMAGAARAQGWPADYREYGHPLQKAIRTKITDRGGVAPGAVIDGCGVPCWVLPLSAMARAWSHVGVDDDLRAIGEAMRTHPWETSGTGRPEVLLMQSATRPLVCKVGAEGLMCGALPEDGLGFAIKVHSGNADARAVATWALLDRWAPGSVVVSDAAPWAVLRNVIGREVGDRRAVWG